MKKTAGIVISFLMMIALVSACSESKQVKTEPVKPAVEEPKVKSGFDITEEINRQVKDFSVDGFPGGSSKLKKNQDLENMKKIVALVKPIIDQMPDGYVMQITGHCSNWDSKAKRKRVSKDRAAKVYNELKKAGVAADKMTYKGVSADEPIEGISDKDNRQRRVSFKAIKK